jgi:hypothetical protein
MADAVETGNQACKPESQRTMPSHLYSIGHMVRLRDRSGLSPEAAHIYRIQALLSSRDNDYRIQNDETGQERVVAESNLYLIERIVDPDMAIPD